MPSTPEVSVVIPTHSRWDLLSTAALPSALGQQGVELEVVVVDDGSTDATHESLGAVEDDRVRVIRHERKRGVAAARNAGIGAARGKWIALLDDDDLWAPLKLRRQLDAAATAAADFAFGGAAALTEDRTWVYSLAPPEPDTLWTVLLQRNVLWGGCSNVLVRGELAREVGGFDERLFQLADWDLWIRLARSGRAAACPEVLVGCIEHRRSMLLTSHDDVFAEFTYVEEKHRLARREAGVRIDRRTFTRWVALGHRRAGRRSQAVALYLRACAHGDLGGLARGLATPLGERAIGRLRPRRAGRPSAGSLDMLGEPPWLANYR